jgi:hypothetical protein
VKPGEIWGYYNPATGKRYGVRVTAYFPPMGESKDHIVWADDVKDPGLHYGFNVTADGIPRSKDGTASPHWKLVERTGPS